MGPHRIPAAEVDVSPRLLRALLAEQHPDLAHLPAGLIANGWDNVIFRLGSEFLARMPRRRLAARLVLHEQRWLPVLAPRLPLPVPTPVRCGRPGLGYPWAWSVTPFLPGEVAARTLPADAREAAASLAGFLAALHRPAAPDAPVNASRGVPLAGRATILAGNLAALGGLIDRAAVMRVWEESVAAPAWDRPPVWVHGDLHPANVLVHHGRISGVIDFGDITAGDPATDLAIAWMLLPTGCHQVFRNAYRAAGGFAASDPAWVRARGWALALSLVFLAHSAGHPELARIGRRTLDAVLAGTAADS